MMNNIFIRIFIISLALFGVYKMFPQVSSTVDYYLKNPKFQSSVIVPAVTTANKILPDKLQIPTPAIMGVSTEYTVNSISPLKAITDEISKQAASLAASQIEQIKQTAADQFCNALLEKVKTECGK